MGGRGTGAQESIPFTMMHVRPCSWPSEEPQKWAGMISSLPWELSRMTGNLLRPPWLPLSLFHTQNYPQPKMGQILFTQEIEAVALDSLLTLFFFF